MTSTSPSELFNADYYANGCGQKYERNDDWLTFFGRIAERIIADIAPKTTLDAGCAIGLLVESLRTRGVEAFGRDISAYAIGSAHLSIAPYCELGSIVDPFPQRYDLIVSIEVLEHMQPHEARLAIANLCRHTDDILFSSTPFDYKEATHFNVQPPEYWAELFAQQGFYRDVDYEASYITEWAVRFRRRGDPVHRIVRDYERGYWILHKENQDLRNLILEMRRVTAMDAPPRLEHVRPESELASALNELSVELAQRDAALSQYQNRSRLSSFPAARSLAVGLSQMRQRVAPPLSSRDHMLISAERIVRAHDLPTLRIEGGRIKYEMTQQLAAVRRRALYRSYQLGRMFLTVDEAPLPPLVTPHVAPVDVVVCIHNALDDVRRCLSSVLAHSSSPYRLILVDDGSDSDTQTLLAEIAGRGAHLIRNETARGYTYAANQGLSAATADFVVLLNSDTVVGPGWLDRLVTCAQSDSRIGIAGPLSNNATWQSVPRVTENGEWANNPLPHGFAVEDMAEAIGRSSARLYPRVPILHGFCLMIRRETLQSVGLFDEESFGVGYGEENDYCLRARAAGWELALADDTYVYHAGSKSYTSEKSRALSERANETLKRKHGEQAVWEAVTFLSEDRVLHGVRSHAAVAHEQETLIRQAQEQYGGRRILWLLPVRYSGGGGAVVVSKATTMREMGIDAVIFNLSENREGFERSYAGLSVPVIYGLPHDVGSLGGEYDAVIATANNSAYWLLPLASRAPKTTLGYFIQDFEPYFYRPDTAAYKLAWASYSVVPQMRRFTTTRWIQNEVIRNTGMDCDVVGGCYNAALFRPRPRPQPDWPERPLRITAMVRPSSTHRAPKLTMEVLRTVARCFDGRVEIRLFGADALEEGFLDLPHNFHWRLAGSLNQRQMATFLNEADIFVDFSAFQALGITAQEAMSCGAAVIVPAAGGTATYARHEHNCLVVDSSSAEACTAAVARLVEDHALRKRLQRNGLYDVTAYHPELPAYNILRRLFGKS